MRRLFATYFAVCALLFGAWQTAQSGVMTLLGVGASAATASCSQSATWFGRVSGLSATEHTAQDTMICGLVTDGVWCGTTMDALYFFATNNTTNAALNMCSSSFSLTTHGSPTFTADTGFTGDATAAFFDTGFNPSTAGGNFVQNSAHTGVYILTSRTSNQLYQAIGNSDTTTTSTGLLPLFSTLVFYSENDACGGSQATNSNAQGFWINTRINSTTLNLYQNDAVFAGPTTCTSVSLQSLNLYVLARNAAGTADRFSGDQVAAAFFGGALTSTQEHHIACRINQALTTMGVNVYANSGC